MPILDIRGTHGSGKSWIVHQLVSMKETVTITKTSSTTISRTNPIQGYYIPKFDCAVLGKYVSVCGGCDQIGNANEIVSRVIEFADLYANVVLEGILVSHTFQRYSNLANRMESSEYNQKYHFLFLDTPLEVCIERVKARRLEQGNTKELDPKNVIKDWYGIRERVRSKCLATGHRVVDLPWENPLPKVLELLSAS